LHLDFFKTDHCISSVYTGIQENTQQFETRATIEYLVGKTKGGTTGCGGNVRSLRPSNSAHCAKWRTARNSMCLLSNSLPNQ